MSADIKTVARLYYQNGYRRASANANGSGHALVFKADADAVIADIKSADVRQKEEARAYPIEVFLRSEIADLRAALEAARQPAEIPEEKQSGQVYGIIDPDYGRIYTIVRKLAWEEGYAIGLHGSFTRDLDMIAVPWSEGGNCKPEKLIARIVQATGLHEAHGNPGVKPHGRNVWTLLLPEFGDPRFVDLSIMPIPAAPAPAAPVDLSDEQILDIKRQVGDRYNSVLHVTDSGICEFARALLAATKGEAQ